MTNTIKCARCKGTGRQKLSVTMQSTLDTVNGLDQPTIHDIYINLPERNTFVLTAAHRRVERLVDMGLLKKVAKTSPARYVLKK